MALVQSALVFPMWLRAVHMGAISFFSMSVGSSSFTRELRNTPGVWSSWIHFSVAIIQITTSF
jgi:hypothetical protein